MEFFILLCEIVGANGMMMSAEEWYDIGNYVIKGNACPCIATKSPSSPVVLAHKFHFVYGA